MTVCLFFGIPRYALAAFEHFAPVRYRLPGFSNSVTLGEIGRIKQSSAAVMHVRSYQGRRILAGEVARGDVGGVRWQALV